MSNRAANEPPLVVGLVNNMPDAALQAAERQFRDLLLEAAGSTPIEVKTFYLAGVPRGEIGHAYMARSCGPLSSLTGTWVDGLIVTGAAPVAKRLVDEPFWPAFTHLADWVLEDGVPALWSCLAAHAAVRYLHGIERHRLGRKLSGVFGCEKASDHQLLRGAPPQWKVPHSRYNDLREEDSAAAGYRVVSRLENGSPDLFVFAAQSVSVFCQGHPEYEKDTLFLEYRRDLGRYLRGQAASCPHLPEGYFAPGTEARLAAWNGGGNLACPEERLKGAEDILLGSIAAPIWQPMAVRLYSNWIELLLHERLRRRTAKAFRPPRGGQHPLGEMEWRVE